MWDRAIHGGCVLCWGRLTLLFPLLEILSLPFPALLLLSSLFIPPGQAIHRQDLESCFLVVHIYFLDLRLVSKKQILYLPMLYMIVYLLMTHLEKCISLVINLKIKNVKQKSLSYNTFTYITKETFFRRVFKRYRNTFKKK